MTDQATNNRVDEIVAAQEELDRRKAEANKARQQRTLNICAGIAFVVFLVVFFLGISEGNETKPSAVFAGILAGGSFLVSYIVATFTFGQLLLGALLVDATKK